jgi:hypothetical protein
MPDVLPLHRAGLPFEAWAVRSCGGVHCMWRSGFRVYTSARVCLSFPSRWRELDSVGSFGEKRIDVAVPNRIPMVSP